MGHFRLKPRIHLLGCVALVLGVTGCISWERGWGTTRRPTTGATSLDTLLERARVQTARAYDRDGLLALMGTYEEILAVDPAHPAALGYLAQYGLLLGTAYAKSGKEKERSFQRALGYSERLLCRNRRFCERVAAGKETWEARESLTRDDADGMGWWATAIFYYFREGVPNIAKGVNIRWIARAKLVMDRLNEVAPEWNGGANLFTYGLYYTALPAAFGGDMKRAAGYFERAQAAGPRRLLVRWGRAKYHHTKAKDRGAFRRDLEWVLRVDPKTTTELFPWAVQFRREARQLLASADPLF
jgi:hypothetical protein